MRIFCCCTSEMKRVLKKHLKSDWFSIFSLHNNIWHEWKTVFKLYILADINLHKYILMSKYKNVTDKVVTEL